VASKTTSIGGGGGGGNGVTFARKNMDNMAAPLGPLPFQVKSSQIKQETSSLTPT
jgi:hypothetical protein